MKENPILRQYKYPETLTQAMQNTVDYIDNFLLSTKNIQLNRVVYLTLEIQFGKLSSNAIFQPLNAEYTKVDSYSFERIHPGWYGKIWFATERALIYKQHMHTMSATELLRKVCIHPNNGSEIEHPLKHQIIDYDKHYKWCWNSRIYEEDWPSLQLHAIVDPQDPYIKKEREKGKQFTIHIVNSNFDAYFVEFKNTYGNSTNKRTLYVY